MSQLEVKDGIRTEEQLQRIITANLWYDSDEEDDSISEDDILAETISAEVDGIHRESMWSSIVWNTEEEEDDSFFYSNQSPQEDNLEDIIQHFLNQISTEYPDGVTDNANSVNTVLGTATEIIESSSISNEETTPSKDSDSSMSTACAYFSLNEIGILQPDRPKYYSIAYEMITSERTYVQSLKLIEKVVHGAVKTANLTGRPILPEQGRKEIFLNVGEIYALSFDLLQELEERISNWNSNSTITDAIAIRSPFFKLYSMYSSGFDQAQLAYCKWLKKSKRFSELIQCIEASRLCKGLPISSYMLCPIQRIPRYRLLLEDYLKHLPEIHPDREYTEAALAAISEAALSMNDRIEDVENQAQVVKMQKNFTGKENLLVPGRKYLGRGPVDYVPGNRHRRQRVLFLFSDILMVTVITASKKYKIRHKFPLKDLMVSVVQSPVLKNAFCIAERGSMKPMRFCTKSLEERNQWIKELSNAKATEDGNACTPSRTSKYASVLNDPEAYSSIVAVLNDPSFELSQPSWVRRSLRMSQFVRPPLCSSLYTPLSTGAAPGPKSMEITEEVDTGEIIKNVETEFMSEVISPKQQIFCAGQENMLLSGYLEQLSLQRGESWKRRWFVLTSRALVCYDNYWCIEAVGALYISGYSISLATNTDLRIKRSNVFQLTKSGHRKFLFHLVNQHEFERWFDVLKGLLEIINV